ncbi:F-box only protein 40 [Scomber japonicus]|uniref:F-box only protein 40 n=1 Tax=Scomber japonicus TaxID=13676 RepID=UPI0023059C19|nr:F-box only protein 40 [Scomber japonicus]
MLCNRSPQCWISRERQRRDMEAARSPKLQLIVNSLNSRTQSRAIIASCCWGLLPVQAAHCQNGQAIASSLHICATGVQTGFDGRRRNAFTNLAVLFATESRPRLERSCRQQLCETETKRACCESLGQFRAEATEERCNSFIDFFRAEVNNIRSLMSGSSAQPPPGIDPLSGSSPSLLHFTGIKQGHIEEIVKCLHTAIGLSDSALKSYWKDTVKRLFRGASKHKVTATEKQRVKNRTMPMGHHEHCNKCYSVHCKVPVQISISCMVIKCRKNCGAVLHMCKEEEHELLCPNETVPCLNTDYGCPLTMLRHRLAKHLEVCPASVVSCSQEWNRWPVSETDLAFYRNISENQQTELHLDVAMALRDQELLFQSIKMKDIFPEWMVQDPAPQDIAAEVNGPAGEAACSLDCGEFTENGFTSMEENELSQEERDALAKSADLESIQNFSTWDSIFKKEMGGCTQTVKKLNKKEEKGKRKEEQESSNCQRESRDYHHVQENAASSMNGETGLAPWQDGALERASKELNISDYNMYLVHNGAMLINFGQLAACTPREKDFVYGNLEPIEVKTVRSFNVPTSYRAKRTYLKDPTTKAKTKHQSVDTADLGMSVEDLPKFDEVSATLLCCLEKEMKGHLISESTGTDGLYVDIGTQTYNFDSAPFKTDVSLSNVIAGKPCGLHVHIEAESVTRRHNKSSSAFSYMCGHFFRRDEYRSHFRNVHSDIQACLNGWFQQRCPLAYLGCTFTQTRFHPAGHQATVKYCQDVSTFVIQPDVPSSLSEGRTTFSPQRNHARNLDPLSSLPLEILQHIAGYLDSFTLSQLSQVSHLMREVCATLLQERGMVSLKWEKKTYSHGGSSWKCRKKVWEFSSLFSSVDRWSFSNISTLSDHLKTCSFYQREERTEPVALAGLGEVRDKGET